MSTTENLPSPNDIIAPRKGDIHRKIREICKEASWLKKDGHNRSQNYDFASYDGALQALQIEFEKHNVRIKFSEVSCDVNPNLTTSGGKPASGALVKMRLYVIDCDTAEFDVIEASNYSIDVGDKAVAQANTGARKYCLFDMFEITTNGKERARVNEDGDDANKNVRDDVAPGDLPAPPAAHVRIRTGAAHCKLSLPKLLEKHANGKKKVEDLTVSEAKTVLNKLRAYAREIKKNETAQTPAA